jgi:head-tail adaptor
MIAIGRRTKQVVIEQLSTAAWDSGYPVEVWTPLLTAWMSREDLGAGERFTADQQTAWGTTRWQMPYVPEMDLDLIDVPHVRRLNYAGRLYDIQSAFEVGRRAGIALITLEKTG